jgi:hypothetical protein
MNERRSVEHKAVPYPDVPVDVQLILRKHILAWPTP